MSQYKTKLNKTPACDNKNFSKPQHWIYFSTKPQHRIQFLTNPQHWIQFLTKPSYCIQFSTNAQPYTSGVNLGPQARTGLQTILIGPWGWLTMTIYSDSRSLKKPNKYVLTKKKKNPKLIVEVYMWRQCQSVTLIMKNWNDDRSFLQSASLRDQRGDAALTLLSVWVGNHGVHGRYFSIRELR